jgi:group I intron endonuclease
MQFEVYLITSLDTEKQYVGFTTGGVSDRWSKHKWSAIKNQSSSTPLHQDMRLYGTGRFKVEVLHTGEGIIDGLILELQEIKLRNTMTPTGYNNLYTLDSREKTSKKQLGKPKSEEHKRKVSAGLTGLKQSPQTIKLRTDKIKKKIVDSHGNTYNSINEASEHTGIPCCSISHILHGRVSNPRHGIKFTFMNEGEVA